MSAMPPTGPSSVHGSTQPPAGSAIPLEAGALVGEADLRRIEQALLDAILDVHPNRSNALDRLLEDMDAADGADDDTASPAGRGAGHSRRQQVEALLQAAVLDTTPADRNRTLDRLLGDTPDPGIHAAYA
jgi:hypothetical protein